jgi:hypothetical protein
MTTKAGVWIDHKQAIVVLVGDGEDQIKKIKSAVTKPARSADGSKVKNWYTPNDFVAEDRLQRKVGNELHKFYDEVIAAILGSKSLLILGPGVAKGEFLKRLKAKKLGGVSMDVETADKMTDHQITAKVRLHTTAMPASKSGTAKKAAPKKTAKATSPRGKKKSGK